MLKLKQSAVDDVAHLNEYLQRKKKKEQKNDDIAPVKPTGRTSSFRSTETSSKGGGRKERTWLQKSSLFDDGYDFGDVSKTIVSTTRDFGENLAAGIMETGERIVDAFATLAPLSLQSDLNMYGGYQSEQMRKTNEEVVKSAKKQMGDFVKKDLYDSEAIAKKILHATTVDYEGVDEEKNSIFGEKTDSLVQSGGQFLGNIGLSAINPALGMAYTVVTAFGGASEEALNEGATVDQAVMSAAISAGAEVLTEKIGGFTFGGKSIGDLATKRLTQGISNKVARSLVKLGVDASSEGFEEILSGVMSDIGQKITYDEDKEVGSLAIWNWTDEQWEEFVGGAVLGGVFGGVSVARDAVKGVDPVSGLTKNEQQVVDKVYKDAVAEQEQNGKKLTQKEKDKLYNDVLDQMEKGYISTDTIEEVLGGETYKTYKDTVDRENSYMKELSELYQGDELNQEISKAMQGAESNTLKTKLSDEVMGLVRGDRLSESYNQRGKRGKLYEVDLSQYDENQRRTYENAVRSQTLNDTRRTHEMVDLVAKISADKGISFDFTNNEKLKGTQFAVEGKTVNGYKTDSGITLNVDSPKYLNTTVGHELTHVLEGTELYTELQTVLFDYAKGRKASDSKFQNEYMERLYNARQLYKDIDGYQGVSGFDAVKSEVAADLVGDYIFTDPDFIKNLSSNHRNVFQKIYDEIKYLCKVVTAGSKEARELEKVKRAFEEAYRAGSNTQAENVSESDTQYSVSVKDKETIDFLENQEHITTYKAMQLIDGKLYPPMAAKVKDENGKYKLTNPSELGKWQQATEDTKNIKNIKNGVGYYTLNKGDGTSVDAAYNPYEHSSNLVLNDQFESAHRRDNLVVVECEIPVSEMSSGYKAEYAKDATGVMDWKSGVVAGKIKGNKRQVYLSRYLKPVRILPDSEVAAKYKEILDGTGVSVPFNVVQPSLLTELEKAGVDIDYEGSPMYKANQKRAAEKKNAKYSLSDDGKTGNREKFEVIPGYRARQTDSDGKGLTFEQMDYFKDSKVRDEKGNLKVMYHGSQDAGFHVFDPSMSDDNISLFFVDNMDTASSYSGSGEVYEAKTIRSTNDFVNFLTEIGEEDYEVTGNEESGYFVLDVDGDTVAESDNLKGLYEEFCDYMGIGYGDANYKVYLNLKNPLVVDAEGRNWNNVSREFSQEVYDRYQSLTEDEKAELSDIAGWGEYSIFKNEMLDAAKFPYAVGYQKVLAQAYEKLGGANANLYDAFSIAQENFSEEAMREFAVKQLKTRDYAKKAKAEGYDGVIFNNVVDYGQYGGDYKPSTVAIAFDSNQVKSVANGKPTKDEDIRFSLSKPVEETKDLMAVHNLSEKKLLSTLELGGFPMPSIAIVKDSMGFDDFGDISVVFPKSTISPTNRLNKVYGGDAWTPTSPSIGYKYSEKVLGSIRKKVRELLAGTNFASDYLLMLDSDNFNDSMNRWDGDFKTAYGKNEALKIAFLKDNGIPFRPVMKEKNYSSYTDNIVLKRLNDELGTGKARELMNAGFDEAMAQEPLIRKLMNDRMEEHGAPRIYDKELSYAKVDNILREAATYEKAGDTKEVDTRATRDRLEKKFTKKVQAEYEAWLDELSSGIVEKRGIRNNRDFFTPSGNRRSFEQLYMDYNLENIVKAMRGEEYQKGKGFLGTNNIFGAATKEYGSMDEIKADSSRLVAEDEETYQATKDAFSDRLVEITGRMIKPGDGGFGATLDAGDAAVDALIKGKTPRGIFKELREWTRFQATPEIAQDIYDLAQEISNMPTGYFEAKPQRAVGLDEAGVFVIPRNSDAKLKQELLNRGYSIAEYDPDIEGDRQRVVNQFEEYKFSLSRPGETPRAYGRYRISGEDVRYAPIREDVQAPVETAAETVAPVVQQGVDGAELFPDDMAPVQTELEAVQNRQAELEREMQEAYAADDSARLEQLTAEYGEVIARAGELEAEARAADEGRLNSLDDAIAPPETEEPYNQEQTIDADPFYSRDIDEVGSRKVKAYMYENPEVKPFFQREAMGMLDDLNSGTKGERWFISGNFDGIGAESYYRVGGTKRHTTEDIAYLLDEYGYTYDEIEKGLKAIIEDNGKENNACSKRIEFMLNDRLMYGYKDVTGRPYPPNQEYIDFITEKQINEYSKEAFDAFMANADDFAPVLEEVEPAPVKETVTAERVENIAPVREEAYEAIRPRKEAEPRMARATPEEQARYEHTDADAPPSRKRARILTDTPTAEKRQIGLWSTIKNRVLDRGMVFEDLSLETGNHEIQSRWNFIRNSDAMAQYFMKHGKADVSSIDSVRKTVEESGKEQEFFEYMYHMLNTDRMSLDERFGKENLPVIGYDVTAGESQTIADRLARENPEFRVWASELYNYNRYLREMLVSGGVISRDTAKLWEEMYPHYVPIHRLGDEGLNINVALDTKRTGVNAPVKRAKGGNRDITNLFDTMSNRTLQTFKAVNRNRFGVELMETLGTVIDGDKVETGLDEAIDRVADQDALLQEGKDGNLPTFTVFSDGERVTFEITEEMYDALKPVKPLPKDNKLLKGLNKVNDVRRGLLTEYNPAFMLTNPIKDTQDVLIYSQHPAKTYANFPKAIGELVSKKGHWYQEYMENGGEMNTYFDRDTNTVVKEKSGLSKVIGFPLEKISEINNFIERVPRMAEYIASRKEGRSIERSMLDAARVTTNFAAGGDLTKAANRYGFTFLNASTQGFLQQARNIREAKHNGLKGWATLAAKVAAAGLPSLLLNHLMWDDDEDYEELSDYVKQNYYIVAKYGDGKFVRIPKGRTLAVIQNAFEQMENLVTGNDEVDLRTFAELAVSNLAPNNPLENNLLAPIGQAVNNKAWYGGDLVPTRLQNLPAGEQHDESTDAISKWLGEKLNISPYKINYVLDQYSGAIGDVLLPYITPEAKRKNNNFLAPITDKFTTDAVMNNQNVSDFYDKKEELSVNANSMNATDEDTLMARYMNSINADLSKLYTDKREVQNSDLPNAEKYEKVREIQSQIVALTRESLATYDDLRYEGDGEYGIIGDKYFQKNDEGEWTKMNDDQVTKYKVTSAAGDAKYASDGTHHYYYYEPGEDSDAEPGWRKITDDQFEKQEEVTDGLGITPEEYWENKDEYDYAYKYPENYAVSKAVGGYDAYKTYSSELYDIKADKDEDGKSISGSRKEKVYDYINGLDIDYGEKIILFKNEYNADDTYNYEIIDYLNSRADISYEEMVTILKKLGFTVSANGKITW